MKKTARSLPRLLSAGVFTILLGCTAGPAAFDTSETRRNLLNSSIPESRIAYYAAAIRENPNDAEALRGLGGEYAARADWNRSAGSFREALILNPADRDAQLGYGKAQLALGNLDEAYRQAQSAMKRRRDVSALVLAGVSLDFSGRRDEAQALYQDALKKRPRDLDVRNNIALSMALAGDPLAYPTMEAVAYAPDADGRHRRNLILVSAITGDISRAGNDASRLGLGKSDMNAILEIGKRVRGGGAAQAGLATFR